MHFSEWPAPPAVPQKRSEKRLRCCDFCDGVRIHSQCRQITSTSGRVGEFFTGAEGSCYGAGKVFAKAGKRERGIDCPLGLPRFLLDAGAVRKFTRLHEVAFA
jgi:hypothetical protein